MTNVFKNIHFTCMTLLQCEENWSFCKWFSLRSRRVIHPKCRFFKNIQHFLVFKYRNIASSAIWHCCPLSRIIQSLQIIWRLQIFYHISQSPDQRNKNLVDNCQSNWTLKHHTKENFKRYLAI